MNDRNDNYNLYEEKKKRKKYLIVIIAFIIILGIGYAYLQTLLNISGTTNVKANSWNVYWDKNTLDPYASEGVGVTNMPDVEDDKTTITFDITLNKPGDYVMFTVDAHNEGTIDAMISSITKKVNGSESIPDYLNYTVSYIDESVIEKKQILRASTSETYMIIIEYKKNIDADDLPAEQKVLTTTFSVDYVQADNTAIEITHPIYSISSTFFTLGQAIPTNNGTYSSYQDAMDHFGGHPVFLRYGLNNNLINQSYIGIKKDGEIYYIKTRVEDKLEVIEQLDSIFGTENHYDEDGGADVSYIIQGDEPDEYDFLIQLISGQNSYYVGVVADIVDDDFGDGIDIGYACVSCDQISACTDMTNTEKVQELMSNCPALQ